MFRRNTRGASSDNIVESHFADDVVPLVSTQETAEVANNTYQSVARSLGLTVSLPKTKIKGTGIDITQKEKEPD